MSSIRTMTFGGNGGDPFSMAVFKEIGLRSDKQVDQITLNNIPHGKNGGQDRGSITLGSDEYISKVELKHAVYLDKVIFTTNKGRSIGGGGEGGQAILRDLAAVFCARPVFCYSVDDARLEKIFCSDPPGDNSVRLGGMCRGLRGGYGRARC